MQFNKYSQVKRNKAYKLYPQLRLRPRFVPQVHKRPPLPQTVQTTEEVVSLEIVGDPRYAQHTVREDLASLKGRLC